MLWIKTLGIVLVMAGFGSYGLLGAASLDKRVQQIRNIRLAMSILEKEVSYLHTPLSRAFSQTAGCVEEPARSFFQNCSHDLQDRQGITISEVWTSNLHKVKKSSHLKNEDIELLQLIASQLGMSSQDEQLKLFKMIQEQMKVQEDKARLEAQTGYKLRAYGGFILGAVIVLLLL